MIEKAERRENESLLGVKTVFDWTFQGVTVSKLVFSASYFIDHVLHSHLSHEETEVWESTEETTNKIWELVFIGIKLPETQTSMSADFAQKFECPVVKLGDRYQEFLRLKQVEGHFSLKYLSNNQTLLQRYDRATRRYFLDRHVAILPAVGTASDVYYMSHRQILKEYRTTTNLRVGFDASLFVSNQLFLNECLDKGYNLNPEERELLLRFRTHKIALSSDTSKAILYVGVHAEDEMLSASLVFLNAARG